MKPLTRILLVAAATWVLWLTLIAIAAPQEPGGALRTIFVISLVPMLIGCVWAFWESSPGSTGRSRRRGMAVALGIAAFLAITLIGHGLGMALIALLAHR
jgi:hypothetical protein